MDDGGKLLASQKVDGKVYAAGSAVPLGGNQTETFFHYQNKEAVSMVFWLAILLITVLNFNSHQIM